MSLYSQGQKEKIKSVLENTDTFGTTMVALVLDNYGTEAFSWDPAVVVSELSDDFGANIPQINIDKLQAILLVLTTDTFFNDWLIFNHVCEALNNDPVDFEMLDVATPDQMAWAITEVMMLQDPEASDEFDDEVGRFIGAVLRTFGFTKTFGILKVGILETVNADPEVSADPELYQATWRREQNAIEDIDQYVKENLRQLLTQLSETPLRNRDEDFWQEAVSRFSQKLV